MKNIRGILYLQAKDTYLQVKDTYLQPKDIYLQPKDRTFLGGLPVYLGYRADFLRGVCGNGGNATGMQLSFHLFLMKDRENGCTFAAKLKKE